MTAYRTTPAQVATYAVALMQHQLVMLGYWIRPYDLTLDARRWRWTTSGRQRSYAAWAAIPQAHRDALIAAARQVAETRRAATVLLGRRAPALPWLLQPAVPRPPARGDAMSDTMRQQVAGWIRDVYADRSTTDDITDAAAHALLLVIADERTPVEVVQRAAVDLDPRRFPIEAPPAEHGGARGMVVDGDMLRDLIQQAVPRLLTDDAALAIADATLDGAVRAGMTVLHGPDGAARPMPDRAEP